MQNNVVKLEKKDLLFGIATTILWGCNFVVIDVGLKQLDPFLLTFLRFFFCAFPAIFFIKKPQEISFKILFAYGSLFACGLWWVVNFAMYQGLSSGLSSLFLQFSAFFTLFLGFVLFKENINKIQISGIILALIGLIMLISHVYLQGKSSTLMGILLVLLAALSWETCNSIVKKNKSVNMVAFIVWSSFCSLPALFILTIAVKGTQPFFDLPQMMNSKAWFSVLFQAYITTILGYMIWNNLMKKYPVSQVAPLSLFVPISGIIASYLLLGERMDSLKVISVIVVILGLAVFINANHLLAKFKA
ncbi:EamA family transporter [Acinetobacter sp. c2-A9]|uniref:EamA family transporter n=1 Tax=Acinetobacter sp. c2-A9 TaxID=3342802 RepID=UPI0035BAB776